MISAIVLSGGRGVRMGKPIPKQYLLLAGKPMIMHSIERLDTIRDINEIIIVCEEEFVTSISLMLNQYNIQTTVKFAKSGSTRQESVYSGLQQVSNNDVIIHEAARPFVLKDDFLRLIRCEDGNVTYGYDIPFTVAKGQDYLYETLKRSELVNIQLPQKFETCVLKKAHEIATAKGELFTEDAGMVLAYGLAKVKILKGSNYNLKITEPMDFILGEIIYKEFVQGRK